MEDKINFSLEACRKNAGFTLREAAKKLGISYQTLSKYENDSSNVSMSLLKDMVFLYQVPLDYIFLGNKYDLIRRIQKTKVPE
ncbi:helix-turn-helix domain-containing protein [Liquorilactobacillus hordei]|uniref:helix-turn-helix domain-containing protein n=1 Tax=Liquorilactobacillus hordei TaxID=468911 RepID=UPI0039E7B8C0